MPESFDPYLSWLGIRDPERPPNHYRLLGVALYESDPEILAHAADRQMSHVRTFQAGRRSAESQRLLNELAAAKVCLLNPAKKAGYDAALQAREAVAAAPPLAVPPPLPVEGHSPAVSPESLPMPPMTVPPPECSSHSSLSSWSGSWIGSAPAAADEPPAPTAAKSGSPLVSAAIVVLALLALVLGGLIVALRNPGFRAVLGLGGTPQDESPARDGAAEEARPKTEEETEPVVEPTPEPKTKTDGEPKPEPKPEKPKPEPPKPPAWVDASKQGIRCGNVEVKIASAAVAWPQLLQDGAKVPATEPCLLISITLENAGAAPVEYAGWGAAAAALKDSLEKSYAAKTFPGATVEGQLGQTALEAGGTATDVLCFEPPAADELIDYLRLPLPAAALGQQGTLQFQIPAAMLTRESAPAPEPKTVADQREDVPDDDATQKALERIRQLFADDFRGNTPSQRKALTRKLLGAARTETNAALRYALLSEACDQAIAGGDVDQFREALRQIDRHYRVDTMLRAIGVLQGMLQPSPKRPRGNEAYKAAAVAGMQLARAAVAQERYEAARELADLAWRIATKYGSDTKDYVPKKEAADLKREVQVAQQEYDTFRAAETVLSQQPDDPAANLTCGLYCISVRSDWKAALPLLAKGKDAALRKLAEDDLAETVDPARMVELAEGWWGVGQQKDGMLRRAILLRAKSWYEKALPGLSGLDREGVNKRLRDAAAIGIK